MAHAPHDHVRSTGLTPAQGMDPVRPDEAPTGGAYGFSPQQRLNTQLYTHAMRGRDAGILEVLAQGADLHDKDDNALRSSAGAGRLSSVALLLDQGADLTARDHHTLRLAVRGGHREVVVLLLERGADLTAAGHESIVLAVEHGCPTSLAVLLAHAQAKRIALPIEVLERADLSVPAGSKKKHQMARDVLAPVLRDARIEQERAVLTAVARDATLNGTTLPGDDPSIPPSLPSRAARRL